MVRNAQMGLARAGREARRRRVLTSSATRDKEMFLNLHLPKGSRRRRAIYGVGAP